MILKFKREIIAIILIICMLFTISAISAADSTTDAVSVTNESVEAASEDVANDNNLAMENDVESLGADDDSFTALNKKINVDEASSNYITLGHNYTCAGTSDVITSYNSNTKGICINRDLTIDGQGYTIDAAGNSRIFYFKNTTLSITLKNIHFKNGYDTHGGAFYASTKNLDIINCTFENNYVTSNPGGAFYIVPYSTCNIINSTFIKNGNSAKDGGACYIHGQYQPTVNIEGSIFLNNTGNQGSAINFYSYCTATLKNSIFLNNGQNTIVKAAATILNFDYNWWGNTADNAGDLASLGLSSIYPSSWLYLDINLNNGIAEVSLNNLYTSNVGCSTYDDYDLPEITFNISSINAQISKNNVTIDKSGKASLNYQVPKNTGTLTVSYDNVELTKEVKYSDAGNFYALARLLTYVAQDGDTIELTGDYKYDSSTDSYFKDNLWLQKSIVIDGKGHILDGNRQTGILLVYGANVKFINITFINGFSSDEGGAIYGYGDGYEWEVINCTFINNTASKGGGAVYNYDGLQNIINSTFINNTITGSTGSAIYSQDSTIVSNSIFVGNVGEKVIDASSSVTANYNWFGNTADNPTVAPNVGSKVTANNWYVLDMTLDNENHIAEVSLNNLYGASQVDYALPTISLNIKGINVETDKNKITLDNTGKSTVGYTTAESYSITASYNGVEITKNHVHDVFFNNLKDKIDQDTTGEITLEQDYIFDSVEDSSLLNGIEFSKTLTIDGKGYLIDAKGLSNIFYFNDDTNTKTLTLKNIIFANATGINGAAVYFKGNKIEIINCTFVNNTANGQGDAIYIADAISAENKIIESTFINNTGVNSVAYVNLDSDVSKLNLSNSIFIRNDATYDVKGTSNVVVDYNWWGNTKEDYNTNLPKVEGATLNNWLVLNITANTNTNIATVSLNNLYENNAIRVYENYALPSIDVNIKGINVTVQKPTVTLDNAGKATTALKLLKLDASLTASYENIETTDEIHYIIVDNGSFKALNDIIRFSSENDVIDLTQNYTYLDTDTLTPGIKITKTITIDGNGNTIDAKGKCGIFLINSPNVVLKNIIFKNGIQQTGGAIFASNSADYLSVENCTFINNTANKTDGGAIYSESYYFGSVVNSTFINNTAVEDGAAIFTYSFYVDAVVDKCLFINNSAPNTVIYAYYMFNCHDSIFLNNNANNLIDGIYAYYGTVGNNWYGNTFDDYETKPVQMAVSSYKWLYMNIKFYEDYAVVSLNNLYTKSSGSSSIYSNYNLPEIILNINSTTLDLKNKDKITIDNTGKAIVPYEMIGETGALTVSYNGISFTKDRVLPEFDSIQTLIDNAEENSVIELDRDYTYGDVDEITNGILINKNITIDGKGHTIDAKEMTRIFNVQALSVTFKNIIFANGKGNLGYNDGGNPGGAIYLNLDNTGAIEFNIDNCTFVNNTANKDNNDIKYQGGAIYIKANEGTYNIKNSAFINNNALGNNGGAIYLNIKNAEFDLYNSSFIANKAVYNGALYVETDNTETTIDKCLFRENAISSSSYSSMGSAIIWKTTNDNGNNVVKNSIFIDNNGNAVKNNYYAFLLKSGTVNIDDNWWGSTTYNNKRIDSNIISGITPTSWLFLNASVSSSKLRYNETATIEYYLQAYDGTQVTEFDNSKLPDVTFDVTSDNGGLNKDVVSLNDEFTYNATNPDTALIEIYINALVYETWIKGPYMVPIVDIPFTMYANQGLGKKAFIKTANGYYSGVTITCNDSELINLEGNYDVTARTTEGTVKLTFTYAGSASYDAEVLEMEVKVVRVPLTINVTNIESKEITLNVTDTLDLDISFEIDEIHKGYAPAWDTLEVTYNSSVISFTYENGVRPDNGSYYPTGHIIAKAGGTTNLTIYSKSVKFAFENYTIKITVNKVPTEVTFDDKDSFKVDDEGNINAIFKNNGTQADVALIYESSDENVFNFTSNTGDFKAMGNGTAVITVKFAGNSTHENSSKTLTVTVTKYDTTTAVTSSKDLSLRINETSQIVANVDSNVGALEYVSSNESVVTVSSTGLITAVAKGTATITVRYPGDRKYEISEDIITLTVLKNATEITAEDKVLKSTDENIDIGATLNITDAYSLEYSSDNESVVTVSADGKLTAVGSGEAHITITYAESEKYLSSTKTITVTVNKIASEIIADSPISTRYLQQITLNPTVKAEGNDLSLGTITYFVDNAAVSGPLDLGESFTYDINRVGKFNITAKYAENSKFYASELNITVNSDKADNIISVIVDDVTYPDYITIKVNATVAGTYTIDINGTNYDVVANDTAGKSVKLAAGSYYANITGYTSDYYYGVTTNDTFTINKATNDVTVSVADKYLPGNVTVSVSASVAGTYHVVINGTYPVDVVVGANGIGQNTIALPAGVKYQANTTFADHQNYTVSITNATFDVNKSDIKLEINIEPVIYGNNVTGFIQSNVSGTYTVKIADGDEFTVDLIKDENYPISREMLLSVANGYHAEVRIEESDNYTSKLAETTFNVVRTGTNFNATSIKDEYVYAEKIILKIGLPDGATGSVTFNYTDGTFIGNISDVTQTQEFEMPVLKVAPYNIRATYNGDNNFNSTYKFITFNVIPAVNKFNVTVDDVTYPNVVTVKVTADVEGTYRVDINGTYYDVVANGEGKYVKLAAGSYYANVTYSNENYTSASHNDTFTVNKGINVIVINVEDIDEPGDVTVKVTATLAGTYTIDINGTKVAVDVGTAGFATNTVTLPAGKDYVATTDAVGDENYTAIVNDCKFTINKMNPNINASDLVVDVNATNSTVIEMPVAFDGKFTFESSNESIATVNNEGVVTGVSGGIVTIKITSHDAQNYSDDSVEITVTVNKIDSNFGVDKSSFEVNVTANESIVITGDFDGNITYTSNDTSVATVDENGAVTGVSSGTAKITVNATGSSRYNDAIKYVEVTVKRIPSNFGVDEDSFGVDVKANKSIVVTGEFDGNITFTSNDTSVATVDENGVVTGLTGGKAKITVKANESSKYEDAEVYVTVTVNKIASNLNASDLVINVDDSQSIVVQPADFDGNIIYESSNSSIAEVNQNGVVMGIIGGNVTITITANNSAKYLDDSIVINVAVNKISSNGIHISPETLEIDVFGSDDFTAVDDWGRELTYVSCNESIATVENGHVTGISGGIVNITVMASETDKYLAESKNITVTVKKISAGITVDDPIEVDAFDNSTIVIDLKGFDGDISYVSSNPTVASVDANGKLTGIKSGNAIITITATNSSNYLDEILEVNVTVNRISPQLNVDGDSFELSVGDNGTIVVTTDDRYDGIVTYQSNDSSIVSVENGVIKAIKSGTVEIIVNATENDKFISENKTLTVTVNKLAYEITLDIGDVTAGENAIAIITTTDVGTLNVTITNGQKVLNNTNIEVTGYYKYFISDLNAGTYNITAKYGGSERYNEYEIAKQFTVKQIYNYEFVVEVADTVLNQITNASITLPADATGKIRINGLVQDIKSVIELPVQNITGQNKATFEYLPDENSAYGPSNVTAYYNVAKKDSEVKINISENVKAGENVTIAVDAYTGAVIDVYVDGVKQAVKDCEVTIPATAGNHNVLVNVAESDDYVALTANATFEVTKKTPTLTINVSGVKVGEKATIDINITDSATGIVIVNVNGTEYTVNLNSAKSIEVSFNKAGKYDITARYEGDEIFDDVESDKIVIEATEKAESGIIVEIPKDIKVGDTVVINVTSNNMEVEVLINGTVQTVKDGKVEYEVTSSGAYTIVVNANETAEFKAGSYVNAFNVDKNAATVEITKGNVEIGKDIEITVKSYENANITVYVDGEAQTLKDGKFTIRATAGVHTITASVDETDMYLRATANDTFTVEKINCPITVNVSDIKVGEKLIIDIDIADSATGIVSVDVNGKEYLINLENSRSVEASIASAGKYNISARYLGDDIYAEADSNVITVEATEKASSNIIVEIPDDIRVGQVITINVTCPNSQLEVLINSTVQKLSNGKVEFEVTAAGNYPIVVNAFETSDYKSNSSVSSFAANKNPAEIDITVGDIEIGYDIEVTVKSYDGADIKAYVDGVSQTLVYGKFYIKATAGNHTITATVGENEMYLSESANRTYEVVKKTPTLTLKANDVRVGEKTTIEISSPEFITGIVIVNVNGTDYTINLDSAKSVDVKLDKVGNYSIQAKYMGDDIYTEADSNKATVKAVEKESSNVSVVLPQNIRVGDIIIIAVVSDNDNITVLIDGVPQTVIDGKVEYEVTAAGSCPIVVIAGETDEYSSETFVATLTAEKNKASVEIILPDVIEIGKDIEVAVKSYDGAIIAVNVDGKAQTLNDNKFTIKATAGIHTILAGVSETDKYMGANANATFTVDKLDSEIEVTATDAKVGEMATVSVSVTENATGVVIVSVGSTEYSLNLENASSIDVLMNAPGKFEVSARYLGDDVFNPSQSGVKTIEVIEKETPVVNVTIPEIKAGDDGNISMSIPNATGILYVIVDGEAKAIGLDENGSASYPVENLKAGNHTITVIYAGDENNEMTITSQSFSIDKKSSDVNVTVGDVTIGEDTEMEISVPDATGNVTVIIDGVSKTLPLDKYGNANFTIPEMKAGDHSIVVIYEGDDTHSASFTSQKVSVKVLATEFTDIVISDDLKIKVVLVDEEGNPVSNATVIYSIAGVNKTAVTQADGSFVISGENGAEIIIDYAGDNLYLPTNTSLKIANIEPPVVVQIKSRFNITGNSITINGYAVDTKAGENGIAYATQLLDINGNPISKVKIQFAVNDKIYNRTTNENGSFTPYNLNMVRAGRYTMAFSFAGDEKYESTFAVVCVDLVKKPIKIKASNKSFKASSKTKKYIVTLGTIVGSSADGKAHLREGMKVTMKINGKTYTSKTNSKGQVTFNLKITKRGKFAATISTLDDQTYETTTKSVKITIK